MLMDDCGNCTMNVVGCARCGNNHDDLDFSPLNNPHDDIPTWWAMCPEFNQPILMKIISQGDSETWRLRVMELDLGKCIVAYAERKAGQARMPIWSVVADILCCGSTSASQFCYEHLPKNGWYSTLEAFPEYGIIVKTAESLGGATRKLRRMFDEADCERRFWWEDVKGNRMLYYPEYWKPISSSKKFLNRSAAGELS